MKIDKKSLSTDLQSRLCIFEILESIFHKNLNFDSAFETSLRSFPKMEGRDIGFVREGAMLALRRKGQIDDIIKTAAERELDQITPKEVVTLLRIGVVQLFFMDVKDHAAVDTIVRLASVMKLDKQKGFINGVLRNLGRRREDILAKYKENEGRINTPEWLYKSWVKDYGAEIAGEIAEMHLVPSPIDITAKKDAAKWAEKLGGDLLHNNSIRLEKSGRIPDLEGYNDGEWWVQNASAAMPVQLMSIKADDHVVDLCAAPGGKTMQLAAIGARVSAVDISKNRMERLRENLKRCGLNADVEVADGKFWMPKRPVDAVLIDAPCSATGTIRHQPDVMYLKGPKDIDRLTNTQKAILDQAAKYVKRGGELIYCTCSLQKAESEDIVTEFISKNDKFEIVPFKADDKLLLPDVITNEGFIRIMPFHGKKKGGMDGFFIARIKRL